MPVGHQQVSDTSTTNTTTVGTSPTGTRTTTSTPMVMIRTDCTKITSQPHAAAAATTPGRLLAVVVLDEVQLDLAGGRHVAKLFVERRNGRGAARRRRVEVLLPVVDPFAQHLVQRLQGRHLGVEVGASGAVVVVVVVVIQRRVVAVLMGGRIQRRSP